MRVCVCVCVCVCARAQMCVCGCAGARVDADDCVCLCVSVLIVCACVRCCLCSSQRASSLAPVSSTLAHTPPPPAASPSHLSIHPSIHPSIYSSVHLSRIRPRVPAQSIIFPVPKEGAKNQLSLGWASGTQELARRRRDSERFAHLPADTVWRKGAPSHPLDLLPSSLLASGAIVVAEAPRSPGSFLLGEAGISLSLDYFAHLLGRPSRPLWHQT